ncbi:MAG: M20/M25/M40 family metallo-hydrolase [Eubacteriales bacterium]
MDLLQDLLGLIAVDSVALVDVSPACPYGENVAKALEYVKNLCQKYGLPFTHLDNKVAWVEIGQGEENVAVLSHLDIVPVGSGWKHNPKGEVVGDRLYGRGVVDDKGPTVAVLHGMAEIMAEKIPLNRRIRLILGQCEEGGDWSDMDYYKANQTLPVWGFTPDADFPAIYGEMGILELKLSMNLAESGILSAQGGDASNMVPGHCTVTFADKTLETTGKSAHASTPEKGENAIAKAMAEGRGKFADFFNHHIGMDYTGAKMGCGFSDVQSGHLTLNAGTIRTTETHVELVLDLRIPVTYTEKQVEEAVAKACLPYGIQVETLESLGAVYMDKNGKVIEAMLQVYRQHTGDMTPPQVIGGGTYARAMDNIVAFGPMQPSRECTEHQPDEYILLEDLQTAKAIYKDAMVKLANLE